MISNICKMLLTLVLITTLSAPVLAMTPEEYCKVHADSGAPGNCNEKDDCAVITTNLGTEECKKCSEGGCELTDCGDCSASEE